MAVNKGCKNKENPNVVDGWKNVYVSIEWLMGWVGAGYGWCATHFADRYRKSENVDGSNMIVIDIDGDCTLEEFWATATAQDWCAATYTSASHTEEEHRFRAIFPFENFTAASVGKHKGAYWLVVNRLLQELGLEKLKDNCGQKAERLWYGNDKAVVEVKAGNCIPEFLLADVDFEEAPIGEGGECSTQDLKRCKWLLNEFLRPSDDGEYESYYVPVMAACAGIGAEIFDDWVEWVLKGHHGAKPENTKAFKWKGLGSYAGHTTLYKFAKEQDPNWTRSLPAHLSFRATGAAAGYSEVDPIPTPPPNEPMATPTNDEDFPEPLPDTAVVSKKRGRPKKDPDDLAKQRESDISQVRDIFKDLRRNQLTGSIEYTDKNDKTVELQGNDLDLMTSKLAFEYGIFIPEQRVKVAVEYAAGINSYCPIRRYLDRCSAHAIPHKDWGRLGKIFLGNSNDIATIALQRMLIGAVARAYEPGCSMSWLPILVGPQGAGKSMFARNLVPQDLFTELTVPLDTLMKESYRLHVGWLLELPEIDHFFKPRNIENFKNLVTTRCDEVRRPYDRLPSKLRRRFVMIGTTNQSEFLIDPTGNRRFVPLEIGQDFLVPWKQLNEERDLIWAAAVDAYRKGDSYEFTAGEIAGLANYIQQFGEDDPWHQKVSGWLSDKEEIDSPAEICVRALGFDIERVGRSEAKRITNILQALRWRQVQTSKKDPLTGKRKGVRLWRRPTDQPINEDHITNDF